MGARETRFCFGRVCGFVRGFRIAMEQFREPDEQMGFFFNSFTMGQILSLPLVLLGVSVMARLAMLRKKQS